MMHMGGKILSVFQHINVLSLAFHPSVIRHHWKRWKQI